jgi:hypothetical protein
MSIINGLKGALAGAKRSQSKRRNTPEAPDTSDYMYCTDCGSEGNPVTVTPGSIWISAQQ